MRMTTKQEPKSELWFRYVGDGRYVVLRDEEISDMDRRKSTENKLWKEATEQVIACEQDMTDVKVSSGVTLKAPTLACGHPQRLLLEPDTTSVTFTWCYGCLAKELQTFGIRFDPQALAVGSEDYLARADLCRLRHLNVLLEVFQRGLCPQYLITDIQAYVNILVAEFWAGVSDDLFLTRDPRRLAARRYTLEFLNDISGRLRELRAEKDKPLRRSLPGS
jgi:hypothetical protein